MDRHGRPFLGHDLKDFESGEPQHGGSVGSTAHLIRAASPVSSVVDPWDGESRRSYAFGNQLGQPTTARLPSFSTPEWEGVDSNNYGSYHNTTSSFQLDSNDGSLKERWRRWRRPLRSVSRRSHTSVFWWTSEVVWLIVSILAMVVIIAVLGVTNGKPPPSWPLGITLNTFLAFFTSFSRMAFMIPVVECLGQLKWTWFLGERSRPLVDFQLFDEASRGAYGSLVLLVRYKG